MPKHGRAPWRLFARKLANISGSGAPSGGPFGPRLATSAARSGPFGLRSGGGAPPPLRSGPALLALASALATLAVAPPSPPPPGRPSPPWGGHFGARAAKARPYPSSAPGGLGLPCALSGSVWDPRPPSAPGSPWPAIRGRPTGPPLAASALGPISGPR